jgi:hypothetical protein
MNEGTCLCGTVRYEVEGPLQMMLHCHCSMCRKHHGAPFATFAAVPFAGFRWKAGEDAITTYQSSERGKRYSCKICGSITPMPAEEMGVVILPVGNLQADIDERPEMHMFVESKAPWYEITDNLPQHAEWPPAFAGIPAVDRPSVDTEPGLHRGSCLCGDVAFEMEGEPMRLWYCHCSRCRRGRSAAHGANFFWKPEQFRWLRGETQTRSFKVPDAKHFTTAFCTRCGGAVPFVAAARGIVIVPAGTLDTAPEIKPAAHIFAGSKAPWFEISGTTPQHEGWPPTP